MEWKERLWGFNRAYGFYVNPQKFNFEFNPERLLLRNLALRTSNWSIYKDFLMDKFPFHVKGELQKFGRVAENLLKLNTFEAARFFARQKVNMLRSDLDYREDTAIFKALHVEEEELATFRDSVDKEWVENHVLPEQLLDRPYVWVDGSSLPDFSV